MKRFVLMIFCLCLFSCKIKNKYEQREVLILKYGTSFNKDRDQIGLDTINKDWIFENIIDGRTLYIEKPGINENSRKDSSFYFGKRLDLNNGFVESETDIYIKKKSAIHTESKMSFLYIQYFFKQKRWRYLTFGIFNDENIEVYISPFQTDSILSSWKLNRPSSFKSQQEFLPVKK